MSTNTNDLASKDFAQQCINSLANIKRSMPKTWKTAIQPYKDEISTTSKEKGLNTTDALLTIINKLNTDKLELSILKIKHLFFLAAYCDML